MLDGPTANINSVNLASPDLCLHQIVDAYNTEPSQVVTRYDAAVGVLMNISGRVIDGGVFATTQDWVANSFRIVCPASSKDRPGYLLAEVRDDGVAAYFAQFQEWRQPPNLRTAKNTLRTIVSQLRSVGAISNLNQQIRSVDVVATTLVDLPLEFGTAIMALSNRINLMYSMGSVIVNHSEKVCN